MRRRPWGHLALAAPPSACRRERRGRCSRSSADRSAPADRRRRFRCSWPRLRGGEVAGEEDDQQDDQEHAERRDLGRALAVEIVAGQLARASNSRRGRVCQSRPSAWKKPSIASPISFQTERWKSSAELAAVRGSTAPAAGCRSWRRAAPGLHVHGCLPRRRNQPPTDARRRGLQKSLQRPLPVDSRQRSQLGLRRSRKARTPSWPSSRDPGARDAPGGLFHQARGRSCARRRPRPAVLASPDRAGRRRVIAVGQIRRHGRVEAGRVGDDLVDQADLLGVGGVEDPAGGEQRPRLPGADGVDHIGADGRRDQAELDLGEGELGVPSMATA